MKPWHKDEFLMELEPQPCPVCKTEPAIVELAEWNWAVWCAVKDHNIAFEGRTKQEAIRMWNGFSYTSPPKRDVNGEDG